MYKFIMSLLPLSVWLRVHVCVCACVTKTRSRLEFFFFITLMSSRTEIDEGCMSEPELQSADQMEKAVVDAVCGVQPYTMH